MRTTVSLDEDLLKRAHELSGIGERSALLHAALKALIEREAAKRLARLGVSDATVVSVPRRRFG